MTALVVGAAVSGRSAAGLLTGLGERVIIYDVDPTALAGVEGAEVHGGEWDPGLLKKVDVVVTSPGVPEWSPPLADAVAAGVPVWSELELGYRHIDAPVVAVTATNGKTTVTELTAAMLVASGMRTAAVGNIGDPLTGAVGGSWDVLVVEASSFQLRFVDSFHARVAVVLNVAPDHLDWHGDFESYTAAKARILERQTGDDAVVFDIDDPGASHLVEAATSHRVPVSGERLPAGGLGPSGGVLRIGDVDLSLADLPRSDAVMLVDIAASAAAALRVGAEPSAVAAAAATYSPGRHRRQALGTWDGITWVDDSKATNPHAALAAIRSFDSVVLIAGGRTKGLDVTPLVNEPNVRWVAAIGEAAPELAAVGERVTVAGSMREAVAIAAEHARPGDAVLLAPGCASFDMFASYADRGDHFAEAVAALREVPA